MQNELMVILYIEVEIRMFNWSKDKTQLVPLDNDKSPDVRTGALDTRKDVKTAHGTRGRLIVPDYANWAT